LNLDLAASLFDVCQRGVNGLSLRTTQSCKQIDWRSADNRQTPLFVLAKSSSQSLCNRFVFSRVTAQKNQAVGVAHDL
jgi:hypothetical protein